MEPDYNNPAVAQAYFQGEQHANAGYLDAWSRMYPDLERQMAYERGFSDKRAYT